jgi:UDP-N-acetylmuramoyl-tripeptide--D-alanyl-D-alanine ligase
MGELGEHAAEAHPRVGRLAKERGLDVVAVGEGAEGIARGAGGADHFTDIGQAAEALRGRLKEGDVVLFKASRGAALERVMNLVFPPDN